MKIKKAAPIHPTITGYDFTKDTPLPRPKAVHVKCLECMGGNAAEVRRCSITDCSLWPYRSGRKMKNA